MPTVEERKASLEIIGKMPMLTIGRFPLLPTKVKNGILLRVTNGMSKLAFDLSAPHLATLIEFSRKESQKYQNTWEQVYAMTKGKFSRFYDYKDVVYERVKKARKSYGLEV